MRFLDGMFPEARGALVESVLAQVYRASGTYRLVALLLQH